MSIVNYITIGNTGAEVMKFPTCRVQKLSLIYSDLISYKLCMHANSHLTLSEYFAFLCFCLKNLLKHCAKVFELRMWTSVGGART